MYDIHRYEICRFENDELLYRVYFFVDGEIAFTVTGDNIRLGLLTQEDLYWDFTFDLPRIEKNRAWSMCIPNLCGCCAPLH